MYNNHNGKYTYLIPALTSVDNITISVYDTSESSARNRVQSMVYSINNIMQFDFSRLKLVAFEEPSTQSSNYTTNTSSGTAMTLNQNNQLSNMENRLQSIENHLREMNDRSKAARL